MDLFDANLLFEDFKNKGTAVPLEANELFEDEKATEALKLKPIRERIAKISPEEAGKLFSVDPDETEFQAQLMLVQRMNTDDAFAKEVVKHYKPSYY
jgi:hypothetical protein